jgi:hypothetical protein
MDDDVDIFIAEEYRTMAAFAGPLAGRISRRLHGRPDCFEYDVKTVSDCPGFIDGMLERLRENASEVAAALNRLGGTVDDVAIELVMDDLEHALSEILDSVDEVKCAELEGAEEAGPLLVAVQQRVVRDVLRVLQTLVDAVNHPERFMDASGEDVELDLFLELDVSAEMAALETWAERQQQTRPGFGWGGVLAAFGLGWWLGRD